MASGKWGVKSGGLVLVGILSVSLVWTAVDYFGRYANHPDLANGSYPSSEGFYLPDWELGQWIAALPTGTAVYLTPTQQDMATILFALDGQPDKLRSYDGEAGAVPLGVAGQDVVYVVRPTAVNTQAQLQSLWGAGLAQESWETVAILRGSAAPIPPTIASFENGIALLDYTIERDGDQIVMTLIWQAARPTAAPLTAFVHGLATDGTIITQDDHPPRGYPTTEWRPQERVRDQFMLTATNGAVDTFRIGWYQSDTLDPVGEPILLEE